MAKLSYGMMISLDGYVNDAAGGFDWGQIDEAVHQHANDEAVRVGTAIYGRRMYETMVYWETAGEDAESPPIERAFAKLWQATDKIVVSKSLTEVKSARTKLVKALTPADVEALKARPGKDLNVSGPTTAAPLLAAGLVDEIAIYYVPILVGPGGVPFTSALPKATKLERTETIPFENGVTFMRYAVKR